MTKNILKSMAIIAILISSFIVVSCDTEQFNLIPDEKFEQEKRIELRVTKEDAMRVAAMFGASSNEEMDEDGNITRRTDANNSRSVQNLSIVQNDRNEPAMFVINYADNEGFILVSASRAFYPVLAHSDTGSFVISDDMPGGLLIWMDEIKAEMEYHKQNITEDNLSMFNALWRQYEDSEENNSVALRNAVAASSLDLMAEVRFWQQQGHSVATLHEFPEFIPWAQGFIVPIFDYMTYSLVVSKDVYHIHQRGPLLTTRWCQDFPFNNQLPLVGGQRALVGCVAVAVGQIMAFHRHPAHYDWNTILSQGGWSTATQLFLRDVAVAVRTNFGTADTGGSSSNINNAASALRNFGYSSAINIVNHSHSHIRAQLTQNQPIYMRGDRRVANTGEKRGHAWVCDGFRTTHTYTYVFLWLPASWNGEFGKVHSITTYETFWASYHMNWGWGGWLNGWFISGNVNANHNDLDYRHNRRDIINIRR